ncbi:MAG: hypothetical protein IKO49_01715 [Bacilli bacterium]|nr:hypothetical protein [Clostridia bacterium]MBR4618009.1 hypothetical protein [Bacilli bacterium]
MKLIEILGLYKAIKSTAKKYHWKTAGDNFMSDHLLFDRIYDDIDDGIIDTIAEQYYMGLGRKDINDVDELSALCVKYEGKSFEAKSENIIPMYKELLRMMNEFLQNIEKLDSMRGINAELDNMASVISQLYGLVLARLS